MLEPEHREADRMSLAEALRTLRRASGLSGERLGDRTGISQSKISKIETGKLTPSIGDVERIVRALHVDRDYADELLDLARVATTEYQSDRTAQQRGWHTIQLELAAIERSATQVCYQLPTMITGLLQTPAYALQAVSGFGTTTSDAARHEIVAHKMDRQQILREPGRHFKFLLTEAALRWRLLSASGMAEQLDKVIISSELDNVSVEVVPLSAQVPDCPLEVCVIYDDRLVKIETSSGSTALRDPRDIAYHRAQFDFFSSHALKDNEARQFIQQVADEFRAEE